VTNENGKKILVTGGAGFIGSHLARRLLIDGYSVAVLTREGTDLYRIKDLLSVYGSSGNGKEKNRLTIIQSDLSDLEDLKEKIQITNPSGVFHCAASNIKSGVAAPEEDLIRVNVLGVIHLIKALEGVDYKFFVNCGSYLEYGTHQDPLQESHQCSPLEIYAITKLTATLYCQSVAKNRGLPILTFRIFSPYGPDMEPGRLFYEVVKKAHTNQEIKLTKPETSRDFIFIDDIVDIFIKAIDKAGSLKGEIFNLGYGHAETIQSLVSSVFKNTASQSKVIWGGAKDVAYDQGCQEANMKKTFSASNWEPSYNLDAGVEKMISWIKSSSV